MLAIPKLATAIPASRGPIPRSVSRAANCVTIPVVLIAPSIRTASKVASRLGCEEPWT